MKKIQSIGVYCSASPHVGDVYVQAALELGQRLAEYGITVVYGGGSEGLMGKVSHSAMAHGGRVMGFMPHHLIEREVPNRLITEIHMVDTMHARKYMMFEHSDAFLILPGGFGTLDESFGIITLRQLKVHDKPILFININNYWKSLKELIKNIYQQGFAGYEGPEGFIFVESVSKAFEALGICKPESAAE